MVKDLSKVFQEQKQKELDIVVTEIELDNDFISIKSFLDEVIDKRLELVVHVFLHRVVIN